MAKKNYSKNEIKIVLLPTENGKNMIIQKTREEIELMRESALIVSKTLGMIASEIKEGVTTLYLDKLAEEFIRDHGAVPSFLGLYDFPNSLCMSPNAQVVHGIPNNVPLKNGDVISVDCGAFKNGYHGDHAYSFEIGEVAPEVKKLLRVTKESLYVGIREFKAGNRVEDVGNAIQKYTEAHGYGVVRELVGHGVGQKMHEEPEMPNYGKRGRGKLFVEGMVVAIEPMINMGTRNIKQLKDGWTILTADGKPSAHFEHDVALIDGKPELLSTFQYIYKALGIESNEEDEFRQVPLVL
ncbi:methionine aminopeptidase, type I [Flavobacterium nitrogenifigens]|uniref:Methionine aminopeptidase n=2 Tax=Flavobacterium TaxID=237 RepID=A0A521EYG7_9FLAO|nr:methionine aminopeptidase, type I [Flavobacterium nitrogenifigens]